MLSTNAYLVAWVIHLMASLALVGLLFYGMRSWRPAALRIVVCTVLAVWLMTPAIVDPGAPKEWMAPAFIVMAFEWWESYEAARRVLEPLLVLSGVATIVALFLHGAWLRWRARRMAPRAPSYP